MLNETPAQLVAHLSHPNGWWRDTAQQLLVLEQDKSVVPALQKLAATRGANNQLARIHALWTLEGLGALDASFVREQMKDADPQIRIQAIRASETLYKAGDRSFAADYRAAAKDGDADVAIQAMLTSKLFNLPDLKAIVESAQAANKARGVQVIGTQILNPAAANAGRGGGGGRGGPPPFTADEAAVIDRGDKVYKELCFTCHGPDGRGAPQDGGPAGTIMAPSLVGSPRVIGHTDYVIKTLLHGMTGPLDGKTYPAGVMMPLGANDDQWVAAIASYVRNSFGNRASFISAADVARVRAVDRGAQDDVDARRTGGLGPAGHGRAADLEGDGQPQRAGGGSRADVHDVEHRRAAAARDVVPGGTAGSRPPRGDSVRVAGRRAWRWRWSRPRRRARGGARRECAAAATPAGAPEPAPAATPAAGAGPPARRATGVHAATTVSAAELQGGGLDGRARTGERRLRKGKGKRPSTVIAFAPVRAKYVRITQTGTAEPPANWSIQRLRLFELAESK